MSEVEIKVCDHANTYCRCAVGDILRPWQELVESLKRERDEWKHRRQSFDKEMTAAYEKAAAEVSALRGALRSREEAIAEFIVEREHLSPPWMKKCGCFQTAAGGWTCEQHRAALSSSQAEPSTGEGKP